MPKLKAKTIVPTRKENAAIGRGIKADPDTYELSDAEWRELKPVRVGRPKADVTKELISIRLSREVLEKFRATGTGWQTRVDSALKDWLKVHRH